MISEEVARAFTIRVMNSDQIYELREMESKLPLPTQCCQSSQIAKHFPDNQKPQVDPLEIEAMNKLWLHFFAQILYPQQQAEEKLHPDTCCVGTEKEHPCSMVNCHHPWDSRCKTKAQEMWQWEDYVLENYKPPQVQGRGVEAGIMAMILVFISVLR